MLNGCTPANQSAYDAAHAAICPKLSTSGVDYATDAPSLEILARGHMAAGRPLANLRAAGPAVNPAQPAAQAESAAATAAVSVVAQGVADFLVDRAEKETSAFATDMILDRLCDAHAAVFPSTCELLAENPAPVGLGHLKRALEQDLHALPNTALSVLLNVIARAEQPPSEKEEPPTAEEIQRRAQEKIVLTTIACTLDVGWALVRGIEETSQIVALLKPGSNGIVLREYRHSAVAKRALCESTWTALDTAARTYSAPVAAALEADTKGAWRVDPQGFFNDVIARAPSLSPVEKENLRVIARRWLTLLTALDDVKAVADNAASVRAIRAGVAAFIETLKAAEGANVNALDELHALIEAVATRDWIGVANAVVAADTLRPKLLCPGQESSCKTDARISATLSLVADVATANTSEGVSQALERFAAPVGTWRRKHETNPLTLTGLVGAKLAYEDLHDGIADSWAFAPTLAVGFELTLVSNRHVRWGLFAQVLDIGNVASVRFESQESSRLTQVEVAPELQIVQLLSPGAYFLIAPRAPFVLGAGVSWVPALRETVTGERVSAWQIGVLLAVDVTIFELWAP